MFNLNLKTPIFIGNMAQHITYNSNLSTAYLKGFFSMLDTILGKAEKEEAKQKEIAKASPNNSKRDQLVPIYMYCKNLWDKWLIHPVGEGKDYNTNPYTVKSFFKNFLFIDSFYRNIYNLLPVNCQKFMNIFDSLSTNDTRDSKSLYSFIGDLAKECNCLFVAVPDYINLGTVDNDGKMHRTGLENMSKIFRCIPHNEMRKIETDNKFIVIYTHEPSKNQDDKKGFANDTINICDSEGNVTEEAKQLFGGISTPKDADGTTTPKELDNMTAGAYPVPSFAVAFSGHNNHIFKSVDVNMDNPIATEHSINVLSYIAQMGSGNGQSVAYQGQDVFPIFSNYAYQSTVTMMGNVQIQPLMYYQLMNIPMWKGAYMIFNVKHSITPGNMTTTFTGMKMSKNTIPFLDKWVYPVENVVPQPVATVASSGDATTATTTTDSNIIVTASGEAFVGEVAINGNSRQQRTEWMAKFAPGNVSGTMPTQATQDATNSPLEIVNRLGQKVLHNGNTPKMNTHLIPIIKSAINEINKIETFTLKYVSCLRRTTVNGTTSNHCFGIAIDFNPNENDWVKQRPGKVKYDSQLSILKAEYMIKSGSEIASLVNDGTLARECPNFKVVQIMAKHGFAWLGRITDFMHFSYIVGN